MLAPLRSLSVPLALSAVSAFHVSCVTLPDGATTDPRNESALVTDFDVQSLVMEMADDYIASLAEAIYLAAAETHEDPKARALAQSFLRNGVGASMDIATGPNPGVALLDLLVLASLQTWAFENHWVPAGIDAETGRQTSARLHEAEKELWKTADSVLDTGQLATLRKLIDEWIAANPDRTVVAFVRFDEFTDVRRLPAASSRANASGLLKELDNVTATVDDARLLGERLIWFAGRYPYVLGEQAELTAYRLAAQPEARSLLENAEAVGNMADSISHRAERFNEDLLEQQDAAFEKLQAERVAAIDQAFERLTTERKAFLDDLASRQGELVSVMTELRDTVETTTGLAAEIGGTVDAVDRVLSRFDRDPNDKSEPLDMKNVRDAAIEIGNAAHELTVLLDRTNETLLSEALGARIEKISPLTSGLVDRAFWRALVLILVFLGGLALLRIVPRRTNVTSPEK